MRRRFLLPALLALLPFLSAGTASPDGGGAAATLEAPSYVGAAPSEGPIDDLPGLTSVVLRYTYRTDRAEVKVLRDETGQPFLSLGEVADFFGVKWNYQPLPRRVDLSRGDHKVVLVLSQPNALVDGAETLRIAPLGVVEGQVAVSPEAAADLLSALLNLQVLFVKDSASLVVGGVSPDDVRREIAEENGESLPPATPPSVPTPGPDQEAVVTPAPKVETVKLREKNRRAYAVKRVVIDPGHGGRDAGAIGYDRRYMEKQATLDIALRVAALLRQQPDLEVLLTRDRDKYITLQYRTEFANRHKADLFVSIHCNANRKKSAKGTETYVYSSRATGSAADAAMRENVGGDRTLDFTFDDLIHNAYRARSFYLARMIARRIQDRLGQKILRIQQAPFYVLARVRMPSVLVETAFITHKEEENKLKDPEWRQKTAQAIADGILAYRDGVEDSIERR